MPIPYDQINAQLDLEYDCQHQESDIRLCKHRNAWRICDQCLTCGRRLTVHPKSALDQVDFLDIPHFDDGLPLTYKKRRQARRKELVDEAKAAERVDFWRKYNTYLQSTEWKAKRERVYRRERLVQNRQDPRCQQCYENEGCFVHHTSYRNVFEERTHQLILVCSACHDEIHGVPPWPEEAVG
jgi:hypothetical protein